MRDLVAIMAWRAGSAARVFMSLFISAAPFLVLSHTVASESTVRPNFLLIVADDLGISDLGAFGGEIETPTLDRLAMDGLRFSDFTAAPTCSPTRAMLLSGTDHHIAGLGNMMEKMAENQRGQPGYEGHLSTRVRTVAKILADSGYRTYISGKWHLGFKSDQAPSERGFQRSFVLLQGAAGHFDDTGPKSSKPRSDYRDGPDKSGWPSGAYSTDEYTDRLLAYLEEDSDSDQPFFAYLSYTAPHWPLQAPQDLVDKYHGRYDQGWDQLRTQRIERMLALGLLDRRHHWREPPNYARWADLSDDERRVESRKMEVYAAMVDRLDQGVARVLQKLRDLNELDRTLIIFLSDNGPEAKELDKAPDFGPHVRKFNNSLESIGTRESFTFLGPGWSSVSNGSYRGFKGNITEGGSRVPAFVWPANAKDGGRIVRQPLHVMDIAPTILEFAEIPIPDEPYEHDGRSIAPVRGKSFRALLSDANQQIHGENRIFAMELFGRRAVRRGDWKLTWEETPSGENRWELFNLKEDPGETTDLSRESPDVMQSLIDRWSVYVTDVGVILPNSMQGY